MLLASTSTRSLPNGTARIYRRRLLAFKKSPRLSARNTFACSMSKSCTRSRYKAGHSALPCVWYANFSSYAFLRCCCHTLTPVLCYFVATSFGNHRQNCG